MSFVSEPQISQMTADFRMDLAVKKDCDTGSASTLIGPAVGFSAVDLGLFLS